MCLTASKSAGVGCRNRTTSFAYRETRCPTCLLERGCSNPSLAALTKTEFNTSMTRIKSMGDRGSPCLSPLRCLITSPGSPLSSMRVVAEESRLQTMLHQRGPNPKYLKTSKRKLHEIESNALDISSFSSKRGCF
uniref:Uncharacterized protein n=1 Tax=Arundo donax TaxID=35708 RepID=A0A0A9HWZ3_ARUDO